METIQLAPTQRAKRLPLWQRIKLDLCVWGTFALFIGGSWYAGDLIGHFLLNGVMTALCWPFFGVLCAVGFAG